MAGKNVHEFTDQNFDREVLQSDVPVLVDFWAAWCGPCRTIAPIVDEIATEYAGRLKVGKVDTDAHQQAAVRYGVQGLPTLFVFKGGQVVERIVGAQPRAKLLDRIRPHV